MAKKRFPSITFIMIELLVLLFPFLTTIRASCVTIDPSTLPSTHFSTPFCQQPYINPPIWIEGNATFTNVEKMNALDTKAQSIYNKMLLVLKAYDCSQTYSYHTCDQCRDYYKTWICLMTMPTCTSTTTATSSDVVRKRPCLDSCNHVLQACPYNLKFSCPKATSFFPHDYSTDTDTCDKGKIWENSTVKN